MFFRKAKRLNQSLSESRGALVRADATLAAFDEAFEELARNERPFTGVVLPDGGDVAEHLQRFEHEYAAAAAHARMARDFVVSATNLARDWGEHARLAAREKRADLAAQAVVRQKQHEADARYHETEVHAWDEMARYCEVAIEQLQRQLAR